MKDFRDLAVWRKAHELTLCVYRLTVQFPTGERFGLVSQMRRSSSSIPCNIAEGCGRGSDADFRRFLQIAMGSASELEYQLLLARDLDLCTEALYTAASSEVVQVKRILSGFLKKLSADR